MRVPRLLVRSVATTTTTTTTTRQCRLDWRCASNVTCVRHDEQSLGRQQQRRRRRLQTTTTITTRGGVTVQRPASSFVCAAAVPAHDDARIVTRLISLQLPHPQAAFFSSSSGCKKEEDDDDDQDEIPPHCPNHTETPCTADATCAGTPNHHNHDNNSSPRIQQATPNTELWKHWKRQLQSPPNIITLSRILSTPLLSYWIVTEHYHYAVGGCIVAGLSDVLDGHIAKHYNMTTVLGTYLDPLADKILINVLGVSLWYMDLLPTPLVVLWMMRDVVLMGATYVTARSHTSPHHHVLDPVTIPLKIEPTRTSKVNTAFQFLVVSSALLLPVVSGAGAGAGAGGDDGVWMTQDVVTALCWLTGGTTVASAWSYVGGASMTKSGNEIRDLVRQRAKEQGNKIKRRVQNTMQRRKHKKL